MNAPLPFAPGCTRESFLETVPGGEILGRLRDGLGAREPFLLLTGEPGTGKTALAHEAIARWGDRVTAAFIAYPALTGAELLEEVLLRLGAAIPQGAGRPALLAAFERVLKDIAGRDQVAVLVVDDAHALSASLLEELRLLANAAQRAGHPFEVLLAGLPVLDATLDDPELGALRQRVSLRAKLAPLSVGETRRYVRHRCAAAGEDGRELFPRTTCLDLFALSGGVPRQLNGLAAEALRLARAANDPVVRSEHVQAAAERLRGIAPVAEREGLDDEDASPAVAAIVAAPPVAPVPTARAAAPSKPVTRAEAAKPVSHPSAAATAPSKPASEATKAATSEPTAEAPKPSPPVSQDPREWVARFVGDRGPLQIGSQATVQSTWAMSRLDPAAAAGAERAVGPARARPSAPPPARSRAPRGSRLVTAGLIAAMVMLALVVLLIRAGGLARHEDAKSANVPTVRRSPGASAAPVVKRVVPSPEAPSAPAASAATPAIAPPREPAAETASPAAPDAEPATAAEAIRGPYTIDVGGYLDPQEAADQRDRAQAITGIRGWVVPAPEGSAALSRVILGIYRARSRADAAAHMLVRSRTLGEATVVHMPPRAARR